MDRKFEKILVLGSGPVKMGQSFEFDYSALQVCRALKEEEICVILANTDISSIGAEESFADKIYTGSQDEELLEVINAEKPDAAILLFRGDEALSKAQLLKKQGVEVITVDFAFLRKISNRIEFFDMLDDIGVKHTSSKKMYVGTCIEAYIISDGESFYVPAIYEHIEKAHVNTGDSLSVSPTVTVDDSIKDDMKKYLKAIAEELKFTGIINVQLVVFDNELYVTKASVTDLELLALASKSAGVYGADLALRVMTGEKLKDMGITEEFAPDSEKYFVRVPKFKVEKTNGDADKMRVTGGVISQGSTFDYAILNGIIASGARIRQTGSLLIAVRDSDKRNISKMVKAFAAQDFKVYAMDDTVKILNASHIPTSSTNAENAVEMIKSNKISYVVSTVEKGSETAEDLAIRQAALLKKIPVFATVQSAHAFAKALVNYNFLE